MTTKFNLKAIKQFLLIVILSSIAIACTDNSNDPTNDPTVIPPAKGESQVNQSDMPNQATAIEGTVWNLVSYNQQPTLAESEITAEFAEGRVNGSAGCNSYFADYQLDSSQLNIETIGSTKKACPNNLMEQETTYLNLLDQAENTTVVNNIMTIKTPNGDLVFEAA